MTKILGGGKLDELSACVEALHGHAADETIATIEVQLLDRPEERLLAKCLERLLAES